MRYLADAVEADRERRSFMQYAADSLFYSAQGMRLVQKWGESQAASDDYDPMEVMRSIAERHGIEVI